MYLPYCYVLRQLNPVYPVAFTKGEKMQINIEVFNIQRFLMKTESIIKVCSNVSKDSDILHIIF